MDDRSGADGRHPMLIALGQESASTFEGFIFDPRLLVWKIRTARGPFTLDFGEVPAEAGLLDAFRAVCLDGLANGSPGRARCYFVACARLIRHEASASPTAKAAAITGAGVVRLRAGDAGRPSTLNQQVGALRHWASTGLGGLDGELRRLVPGLSTTTGTVGRAVRTKCAEGGALPDADFAALSAMVEQERARGRVSPRDHAIFALTATFGCRPAQLAVAKVGDLRMRALPGGGRRYWLRLAILKQGRDVLPRTTFAERELSAEVGAVAWKAAEPSRLWAAASGVLEDEAPLLLTHAGAPAGGWLAGYEGHMGAAAVSAAVRGVVARTGLVGTRTGRVLKAPPVRLRRTVATRLAASGAGMAEIAALLTQSSPNGAIAYVEGTPEHARRVDAATRSTLAPLAAIFLAGRAGRGGKP